MDRWLKRRWARAQQIAAAGKVRSNGDPNSYYVESGSAPGLEYDVVVNLDGHGRLRSCSCTCPDFASSWRLALNPWARQDGVPRLHGIIVCKHVLAAALVRSQGLDKGS